MAEYLSLETGYEPCSMQVLTHMPMPDIKPDHFLPFVSDESLTVHAGEKQYWIPKCSIGTPVIKSTTRWFDNSEELIAFREGRQTSFEYARYGNPTTKVLEEKISALERAESTLFVSSGMGAIVSVLLSLVTPGGHVVATKDSYWEARMFIQNKLSLMGVTATFVDMNDMDSLKEVLQNNKVSLFYADSPSNPLLNCLDIKQVSDICHSHGALVCIDSSLASPINQKPLTLGADLVLHSATKYISGHHDVVGGCVSGSENLISKIRSCHYDLGSPLVPDAAYMIIRGMKTLHLRVETQNNTALKMAQLLEKHPRVNHVYYPGLPSHPEHDIARSHMSGYGGVVSFEVAGDLQATMKFVDSLKLPYIATSFGGCESLVQQPAIMSFWDYSAAERAKIGIKDNLIRFSFGIEKFEDLAADILQALQKM
ncbi:Cystathionine gamma-lyase [Rhynchospora pubera]|uniref:plant cystathionine gamma-synthase n=2 Tax=Rhynchospora pubera TaxID=906938 RepID=A0AAV8BVM9_9POAL|nr:Cystathionine gamma-lyase [Rhynchospora pubera]